MDITDEWFWYNLGWVDFVKWDYVAYDQNVLYGSWEEDSEEVIYADRLGLQIIGNDTIHEWCSING